MDFFFLVENPCYLWLQTQDPANHSYLSVEFELDLTTYYIPLGSQQAKVGNIFKVGSSPPRTVIPLICS